MELVDYHSHSTFSDGELSVEKIEKIAKTKKIKIGVSDHYSHFIGIDNSDSLKNYLEVLEKTKLLKSVEICLGASPSIPENLFKRFDYIIGSVHFIYVHGKGYISLWHDYFVEDIDIFFEFYTNEIIRLINSTKFHILAHPFMIPFFIQGDMRFSQKKTFFSNSQIERIIDVVKKKNIALELSTRYELPQNEVIEIAKYKDVKFACGSDSHKKSDYGDLSFAKQVINTYFIEEKDLFFPKNQKR